MSWKQAITKGWIILAPMGKDFNGKLVWVASMRLSYPTPVMYTTKADAMRYKLRGEKVVRATVTTEWEDVS